jgi:diphosphomevalonate decarboxylase
MSGIICRASPSLAVIKYWGKQDRDLNIPATSSLAVTLDGLFTETKVKSGNFTEDRITVNGVRQQPERYAGVFACLRSLLGSENRFEAESSNNFPTSAGLASSSSGFAALVCACALTAGRKISVKQLSETARIGSASAARAVYGGFTALEAGACFAETIAAADFWPELRVVVAVTEEAQKALSSRDGMLRSSASPYYPAWLDSSKDIFPRAVAALKHKDLPELGRLCRLSTYRMHAAALSADPPILYWTPRTLALIQECGRMRRKGIGAWETMDAGPQVKILCLSDDTAVISNALRRSCPGIRIIVSRPGGGPQWRYAGENEDEMRPLREAE